MYLILLIALCLFALMFGCADSNNDPLGEEASSYKKMLCRNTKTKGKSSYIPWSNVIRTFSITQNIPQFTTSELSIGKGLSTATLLTLWDRWFFSVETCPVHYKIWMTSLTSTNRCQEHPLPHSTYNKQKFCQTFPSAF